MPYKQTITSYTFTIHKDITRFITKFAFNPSENHWKISQILGHVYEADKLLNIRFKLEHAARNLPMLIELICKAP